MKKYLSLAGLVFAAGALGATAHTVSQKGLKFSTETIIVTKGETVVFTNEDRTSHNITVAGDGVEVNGGLQSPGADFRMPFSRAGTFHISCGIHPKMKMTIVVE